MEIILPVAAAILIVIFVSYLRRSQPKETCPQCGSQQLRQLDKQLEKIQQNSTIGYAMKLDVTLILKTTYRCQHCGHTWSVTAPEK